METLCSQHFKIRISPRFRHVLRLVIRLSREEGWDLIDWFNPATLSACPKPGPGFQCHGVQ